MSAMAAHRRLGPFLLVAVLLGAALGCGTDSSASERTTPTSSPAARARAAAAAAASVRQKAAEQAWAKAVAANRRAEELARKDRRLFLMSDSVMLGAQATLPKALPTWKVNLDGKESRFFPAGLEVLAARRREIGRVAVIQMGNNYSGNETAFRDDIDQAMKILSGVRWVVFLTVFEYRTSQAEVNNELRAAATRYRNLRVADWNAYERANPGHTSRDGLHLKPSGATLMAGFIASVVNALPA